MVEINEISHFTIYFSSVRVNYVTIMPKNSVTYESNHVY